MLKWLHGKRFLALTIMNLLEHSVFLPAFHKQMLILCFRSYIESAGHTCELRDAGEFQSPADVVNLVSEHPKFEAALAIHLFKAGRLLMGKLTCCYIIYLSAVHFKSVSFFAVRIMGLQTYSFQSHTTFFYVYSLQQILKYPLA